MADLIESLSGITAPVIKLIEVVNDGIGTLYAPRRIRKEADARAYEIVTIEKAKTAAEINRKEQVKYPTFCQLMKNWEKTDYTTMFQN